MEPNMNYISHNRREISYLYSYTGYFKYTFLN